MGLVHERVFKCVCMCAWIRPLQENYHFRFHSITASKHIQAFITHFIRLMFTDPDNVKPKGPSLERNSEKFSLSFWCKDNINSVSFLCSERPQLFEWTYNNLYSCIILIHVGCHSWTWLSGFPSVLHGDIPSFNPDHTSVISQLVTLCMNYLNITSFQETYALCWRDIYCSKHANQ